MQFSLQNNGDLKALCEEKGIREAGRIKAGLYPKGRAKNATDKIVYEMVEFIPRIQLEVVVNDEMVDKVVNLIQKFAHTGNTGDGKIFVSTVDDIVKIRTNERGRDAI